MARARLVLVTRGGDPNHVASLAAQKIASELSEAIASRRQATLALSGGASPVPMFERLAAIDLQWPAVHIFQVDERVVAPQDPDRNWASINRELLKPTKAQGHCLTVAPGAQTRVSSLLRSSDEARVQAIAGEPPVLDVVHLGLGMDGHTASWPPQHRVVESTRLLAHVAGFNGHDRVTLTPHVVNAARSVVWLVVGQPKRGILERLLAGDSSIPASVVVRDNAHVFTDIELAGC